MRGEGGWGVSPLGLRGSVEAIGIEGGCYKGWSSVRGTSHERSTCIGRVSILPNMSDIVHETLFLGTHPSGDPWHVRINDIGVGLLPVLPTSEGSSSSGEEGDPMVDDPSRNTEFISQVSSDDASLSTECSLCSLGEESQTDTEEEIESLAMGASRTSPIVRSDLPSVGDGSGSPVTASQAVGDTTGCVGHGHDSPVVKMVVGGAAVKGSDLFFPDTTGVVGHGGDIEVVENGGCTGSSQADASAPSLDEWIICLQLEEEEESTMSGTVQWILRRTRNLMAEMGYSEHKGMHRMHCCRQPVHVSCLARTYEPVDVWKCPYCRRILAKGLLGPFNNIHIDPVMWQGNRQELYEIVQKALVYADEDMQVLIGQTMLN